MSSIPQPLFVTKYRPITLDDFFQVSSNNRGQYQVIQTLMEINDMNILFVGPLSCGKTTLLNILIRTYYELPAHIPLPENNIMYINSLKEQGIGFFRSEMKTFCQASSTIFGKKKMVVIDDIDLINEQSQQVFRNYIDKYKHNIHFLSVCTNVQKVIESFQSRVHILQLESPQVEQLTTLYHRVVDQEQLVIDDASKQFIFTYCASSIRSLLNQLEKISIVACPITLDICMKLCTDISFQQFETYFDLLRRHELLPAIQLLLDIYDYGYSVVDIYDYLFSFVKGTGYLQEMEKYQIIKILCEYITIFHSIHEDSLELAIFTNKIHQLLVVPELT